MSDGLYGPLFRTALTRLDPEQAHHLAHRVIRAAGVRAAGPIVRRDHATHPVSTMGLTFTSPFGVAAGFDKDATAILGLGALGFGHVEIGTITAIAQPGNPKPRLFRLVDDRALINRMGFNNVGATAVAPVLRAARARDDRPVIGVNIGKSRVVEVDDAIEDYLISTRLLAPLADYLAVNVSSPNTPGLRGLQDVDKLGPLLAAVKAEAGSVPLLVKIAPDLDDDAVRDVTALALDLGLAGLIATNTSLDRSRLTTPTARLDEIGAGGLSGAPVAQRSREVLDVIRGVAMDPEFCVISVGGVFTGGDVAERLAAGATLVQGYTGFIYRGPNWARAVARELAEAQR